MTKTKISNSEFRAYNYIKDQLKLLGWDVRNPSRTPEGKVYTQQECWDNDMCGCADCMHTRDTEQQVAMVEAKLATEAMRDPTEEMIEAGNRASTDGRGADECWPDMIDAALKE